MDDRADIESLVRAGDEARRGRRYQEAMRLYRRALHGLPGESEMALELSIWPKFSHCAELVGEEALAEAGWHEVVALSRRLGVVLPLMDALGHLGLLAASRGNAVEAAGFHHEALALARHAKSTGAVADQVGNLGLLALHQGRLEDANAYLHATLSLAESLEDRERCATALNALGELARTRGDDQAAKRYFNEALSLYRQLSSDRGVGLVLSNLGRLFRAQGELSRARVCFEEALHWAHECGEGRVLGAAWTNLGNVLAALGDNEDARRCYESSRNVHGPMGDARGLAGDMVNLANLALQEGRCVDAEGGYLEAVEAFESAGLDRNAADVLTILGQLKARAGELLVAEEYVKRAHAKSTVVEYGPGLARLTVIQGALAGARGASDEALELLRAGVAQCERLGRRLDEGSARLALAEVLAGRGDISGAVEEASRAQDLAERAHSGRLELEATALCARMKALQHPSERAFMDALARCDRLEEQGRVVEAIAHRVMLYDGATSTADNVARMKTLVDVARTLGLPPLRLEAESVLLAHQKVLSDVDLLKGGQLVAEARKTGLSMLTLRVWRRWVSALVRAEAWDQAAKEGRKALTQAETLKARGEHLALTRLLQRALDADASS